jgi:putative ubiquitin-RnfH superfamily antitoxin RatB of RatAB toxin-antitoxin module
MAETIHIEVVYALPDARSLGLSLPAGSTVGQACDRGLGLLARIRKSTWRRTSSASTPSWPRPIRLLRDRDRVEIYRPLIADPKEVRKQRAAEGKVMKKGGGDAG